MQAARPPLQHDRHGRLCCCLRRTAKERNRAIVMSTASLRLLTIQPAHAGSATWSSNPPDPNLWGDFTNWVPQTEPNGPNDTATFATSSVTYIDFDIFNDFSITVDGIHFVPGADAFTIANYSASMFFEGVGVTNDSGVTQNFTTTGASGESTYYFDGTSTAGTLTAYTMQGGSPGNS